MVRLVLAPFTVHFDDTAQWFNEVLRSMDGWVPHQFFLQLPHTRRLNIKFRL
jgi:hypothetical protein